MGKSEWNWEVRTLGWRRTPLFLKLMGYPHFRRRMLVDSPDGNPMDYWEYNGKPLPEPPEPSEE